MARAHLVGANLQDATLKDTRLQRADLTGAQLIGADLSGASFRLAKGLTQAQLDSACGSVTTALPEGLTIANCE